MKKIKILLCLIAISSTVVHCNPFVGTKKKQNDTISTKNNDSLPFDTTIKTAHVFVALCDNKYQGIVPVPEKIGNGQDPANNLYWGAMYGVKTYFKNAKDWKLIRQSSIDNIILERLVFKHKSQDFYLIADAYDGKAIKRTTTDFLYSSTGQQKDTIQLDGKIIGINGNANLLTYIGHDGLMDFEIDDDFKKTDQRQRDVIILACYSQKYFSPLLEDAQVNPLVWTSHLMAPEAYILHDALSGYLKNEPNKEIQNRAAKAYSKYQKCSLKAASNLLVTGWRK